MKPEPVVEHVEDNHPGKADFWRWHIELNGTDSSIRESRYEVFAGVWRHEDGSIVNASIQGETVFLQRRQKYDRRVRTTPHWATAEELVQIREALAAGSLWLSNQLNQKTV